MKYAVMLAIIALATAAPDVRQKRQYPLLSTTTTTLHQNPVPVVQPMIVREFIHESPMPVTEAPVTPIVQSRSEEVVQEKSDMQSNMNDQQISQENVQTNSGLNSDVAHQENLDSAVTPLPVVSSTTLFPISGQSSHDIIVPGLSQDNVFTRTFSHEIDPHLSVNGQSFNSANGQSFPLVSGVNGQSFPSVSLPLSQGSSILPLNSGSGILPLTQGLLPLTQGLFPQYNSILPVSHPITYHAGYNAAAYPAAYRAFPFFANPIVTESHHVLPPRPAARQFPIITTTTLAPEVHQVRDSFPIKGHNVRSGVKGGDMGTRSSFPVKGHSV